MALTGNDVDENLAAGTLVGTVSASDPDAGDSWTYSITDASGNFTIDPNSGEIRTTGALDHDAQDSYTVTIAATDAGRLTTSQTVTLNVNDINEAPVNVTLTGNDVDENLAAGEPSSAPSRPRTRMPATAGPTASPMRPATLPSIPTAVRSAQRVTLDHEAQDSYTVTIAATDAGGLTTSQTVTLNVNDINEAPINVTLSPATASTRTWRPAPSSAPSLPPTPMPATVGPTAITDASGNFTIDPNSGEIRTTGTLDHEAQDSYTVTIAATDAGGLTTSQTVTLNVNDINEAPINVALTGDSVDENLAAGALVGTVSASDPDAGDSWTRMRATLDLLDHRCVRQLYHRPQQRRDPHHGRPRPRGPGQLHRHHSGDRRRRVDDQPDRDPQCE